MRKGNSAVWATIARARRWRHNDHSQHAGTGKLQAWSLGTIQCGQNAQRGTRFGGLGWFLRAIESGRVNFGDFRSAQTAPMDFMRREASN